MMKNKILFVITADEVQYDAVERIGRKLTEKELRVVKKGLEWGLLTGIDTIYNTIYDEMLEMTN
ncbi:MAG TPA: hypothetical protein DCQ28_13035 [Bacteroidetes bacterium]|nr:hypothetical protein [Bacteroidota bacterium]